MSEPTVRALAACATALAYTMLCLAVYFRQRQMRIANAQAASAFAGSDTSEAALVLFASQTGQAEALAWQTARWLHEGGMPAQLMPLNKVDANTLRNARRAFFIASTYGEGDPPDGASVFTEQVMGSAPDFSSLRYAVLALGDRQYANFCAFGRLLDEWLHARGAIRHFGRIEVDNGDPATLAAWEAQCSGVEAVSIPSASPSGTATRWRLAARTLLNAGSAGAPVFELAFAPLAESLPTWESGDIAQITLAKDPGSPRDYSIASVCADGKLQLLVRQERHPDGSLGAASGLLTSTLAIGDTVEFRIRPHRNFRLDGNAERPLILIGNGTGLAGLRGHLRARVVAKENDNWLIFGERNAEYDFLCRDEIEAWRHQGVLKRIDMVFSRDQEQRIYVQHRLLQAHDEVRGWVDRGAAIYVCGSMQGMASGVDAALRQIVGAERMSELAGKGRYRRDVY